MVFLHPRLFDDQHELQPLANLRLSLYGVDGMIHPVVNLFRSFIFPPGAALFILNAVSPVAAESNWPSFLGPGGIAVVDTDQIGVPISFKEWDQSLLWKIPSGSGHSSPCIWGRYLFLTSAEDRGETLVMRALDRISGKSLWEHRVKGEVEENFGHGASNPAAPTPCTDGKRVFFYFGGYGLIASEVKTGRVLWEKRFPFSPQTFGTGDSPVLFENSVILAKDGGADSALWCFDALTGDVQWKAPRPGQHHNYSSPFVWKNHLRTEIVKPGTNSLKSYDPKDGKLLWSVGDLCVFPCTTPTGDRDRLYFAAWATPNADRAERVRQDYWGDVEMTKEEANDPDYAFSRFDLNKDGKLSMSELPDSRGRDSFTIIDQNKDGYWSSEEIAMLNAMEAPGRNLMVAIDAGHDGELTESAGIAWTFDTTKALPYVPSPLLVDGRIHLIKSGGVTTCLDAMTGAPLYGPRRSGMSGEYFASPIAWGDGIFFFAQRGTILVLAKGDQFEILAQHDLGEEIFATPAISGNILYLRTADHLWAIRGRNK